MTSKERVKAAIHFLKPDRLPVDMSTLGISDLNNVKWNQTARVDPSERYTLDEWGCGWSRSEVKNMGIVTYHPLNDWTNIDEYKFPDPQTPEFYSGMDKQFLDGNNKYVLTNLYIMLFERLHSLRGYENLMIDLYENRDKVEWLADKVVNFNIGIIENISARFPGKINGIMFTDDWGTQLDLMINPELWNEIFKPRYKLIFDACKKAGWDTWLHSCGKIDKVIQGFIDVGLDVINLQQPRVFDIEEIGRQFAGKICFLSLCDIQHTLPFESDDYIKKEAELLLKCWGTPMGGFIFGDYGDNEAINVSIDRYKTMFEGFLDADYWK